jgi:CheY-like chemotaxis protein
MLKRRFKMPALRTNLLIVDDDAQLRSLLTAILTQAGYRVRSAEDGFSALVQIRADMPDVILSDLYMLGMSGFELLSVVRRRFPAVAVIAMSSAFSGGEVPNGVAADAFYQKATSVVMLLKLVEKTCAPEDGHAANRYGESAPIWVAAHPIQDAAHARVVLSCPECLRSFDYTPSGTAEVVHRTDCAYCMTLIHYAMVQPVDPVTPRSLEVRRPATANRSPGPPASQPASSF